jgi:hypothetical protein
MEVMPKGITFLLYPSFHKVTFHVLWVYSQLFREGSGLYAVVRVPKRIDETY